MKNCIIIPIQTIKLSIIIQRFPPIPTSNLHKNKETLTKQHQEKTYNAISNQNKKEPLLLCDIFELRNQSGE